MMLGTVQNTVVVIICVGCSLSLMAVINYFWPATERRTHNDLIGWQLSVLGTTYAVIIGFMLYTTWTDFGSATLNADAEANSLVNLFRLSDALPAPQADQIKKLARAYADVVVNQEWIEMASNESPTETSRLVREMWTGLASVQAASSSEVTAYDHALSELSSLAGYRRIRLVENGIHLPGVLWFVLVMGAVVTIASTCLFGNANGILHTIQVAAFSLLISLALVAIADINRPYQGGVHVSDYPFRRAQIEMQ
jgi:hypothetical protein